MQATHQFLVYTRHIDSRGENVHTMKNGEEGVLVASKEVSIARVVTAGKTKHVVEDSSCTDCRMWDCLE